MRAMSNNVVTAVHLKSVILEQIESRKRALLGKKDINKHILKHLSAWFNIEEMHNNYRFTNKGE
tara:strand:- start:411 stop:602 length:192 start_codon:yes stop_codon:yes gene_type:complete